MFDLDSARKAGYSDNDIAEGLAKEQGVDFAAAQKAGYSATDMLPSLVTGAAPKPGIISRAVNAIGDAYDSGVKAYQNYNSVTSLPTVRTSPVISKSISLKDVADGTSLDDITNKNDHGEYDAPRSLAEILGDGATRTSVNVFGGLAGGLAKSAAAVDDVLGDKKAAEMRDQQAKNWQGVMDENGGDTPLGKVLAGVGGILPALVVPEAKALQLVSNAGMFGVPAFRDTLNAELEKGEGFGAALMHASTAFGINMAMPALAKGGSVSLNKLVNTQGLGGVANAAAGFGKQAVLGAGLSVVNSVSDKGIDNAFGEKNDNDYINPEDMGVQAATFGVIGSKHIFKEARNPVNNLGYELNNSVNNGKFDQNSINNEVLNSLNPNSVDARSINPSETVKPHVDPLAQKPIDKEVFNKTTNDLNTLRPINPVQQKTTGEEVDSVMQAPDLEASIKAADEISGAKPTDNTSSAPIDESPSATSDDILKMSQQERDNWADTAHPDEMLDKIALITDDKARTDFINSLNMEGIDRQSLHVAVEDTINNDPRYKLKDDQPKVYLTRLGAEYAKARNNLTGMDIVDSPDGNGYMLYPKESIPTEAERNEAQRKVENLNTANARGGVKGVVLSDNAAPAFGIARTLAKVFGVKAHVVSESDDFNGVFHRGEIFLSKNSSLPALAVTGHEVQHNLETSNKDLYKKMSDLVTDYLHEKAMPYRKYQEDSMTPRDQNGKLPNGGISLDGAKREVIADLNGEMWMDHRFWREMIQRDPNLFRQVAYHFAEVTTKAIEALNGQRVEAAKYVKDVDAVRKIMAQTWAEHLQSNPNAGKLFEGATFARKDKEDGSIVDPKEAFKIKALGFAVRGQEVSGSPPFIKSIKDIRNQIKQAVADALSDQAHPEDAVWYREAGRAIREYSHGDDILREKLTRIVAKLSQGAGVNTNVSQVIKAAYQIAKGETPAVGRFPNVFREQFGPLVEAPSFDKSLKGVDSKLQNFYRNLHDETFQKNEWPNAVVVDRHAINYIWHQPGKDTVASDAQYNYAEKVIQLATAEYNKQTGANLNPRDMQALLWGHWKRREAAATQTESSAKGGAWNYPQFFERATANVTAEVIPSKLLANGASLEKLSYSDKQAFQKEALDVIFENGQNQLAKEAGLILYKESEGSGGYDNNLNPNHITGALAKKEQSDSYHRYSYDSIDKYARGWQYIFSQDGVPWFRADVTADPADLDATRERQAKKLAKGGKVGDAPPEMSLGFFFDFDHNLSHAEEAEFYSNLKVVFGDSAGYTKVAGDRIAVVNYRGEDRIPFLMSDSDFKVATENLEHKVNPKEVIDYGAESKYHYHDFENDPAGLDLQKEALDTGGSDWQEFLRGRRDAFNAIADKWAAKANEVEKPQFSLKDDDGKKLTAVFGTLMRAQGDTVFRYPRSNSDNLKTISNEVSRGKTILSDVSLWETRNPGETMQRLEIRVPTPEGIDKSMDAFVSKLGNDVWINVAGFKKGNEGALVYSIVGNWAHNNGYRFIGDPAGLSPAALTRRLQNMLSLSLKFGDTSFVKPHQRQIDKLADYGFKWTEGDDQKNLQSMLYTTYNLMSKMAPELRDVEYNFRTNKFEEDGKRFTDEDFLRAASKLHELSVPGAPGSGTLKIGATIGTIVRGMEDAPMGESSESVASSFLWHIHSNRMAGAGSEDLRSIGRTDLPALTEGQHETGLDNALYSRKQEDTPAFKEWFGDSKVVDDEGKPLVMYHGTPKSWADGVFREDRNGLIFLTPSTKFANEFSRGDEYANPEHAEAMGRNPNVLPVYVKADKPFEQGNKSASIKVTENIFDRARKEGKTIVLPSGREVLTKLGMPTMYDKEVVMLDLSNKEENSWASLEQPFIIQGLKDAGFDSVYIHEKGIRNLAVFEPNQIKSATGNNGDFSKSNNDIRYSRKQEDTPAFKEWFGDSKVVDAEGKPLVVYHGTDKDFDTFEISKKGLVGPAIYFTTNEAEAKQTYSNDGRVIPAYLKSDKILRASKPNDVPLDWDEKYDAVILRRDGADWYAVKDPNQIKSAIGNNGDFSKSNNDIRYSLKDSAIEHAKSFMDDMRESDIVRNAKMMIIPMSTGSMAAKSAAQKFANAVRVANNQWQSVDQYIVTHFNKTQREDMWNAADRESVLLQEGKSTVGQGLDTLPADQRAVMETMHKYSQELWQRAKDTGMVNGDGLKFWTPRMAVVIGMDGEFSTLSTPGKQSSSDGTGSNLYINSPFLKGRKYLHANETEDAMRNINPDAELVRDARTMPLAMARLEQAIAGRELVNQIKTIGQMSGKSLTSSGMDNGFVTIDHPALTTYTPRLDKVTQPDGSVKFKTVNDENGKIIMERKPIYIDQSWEGPLRAVLSQNDGAIYRAYMLLKSKAMSAIMVSPLVHLMVIGGRALAYNPAQILSLRAFFVGNALAKDPELLNRFIGAGLVHLGGNRSTVMDVTDIARGNRKEGGWGDINESWVSKSAQLLVGTFNKQAGVSLKEKMDAVGEFYHHDLLWKQVGALQLYISKDYSDYLVSKGHPQAAADAIAVHLANRYGGAVARENMSAMTRKFLNVMLFSRSFNVGNIGAVKDTVYGLPAGLAAKIYADVGQVQGDAAMKAARGKARMGLVADLGMSMLIQSATASAIAYLVLNQTSDDIKNGYMDRLKRMAGDVSDHPLDPSSYNPMHVTPMADNEPGKENRIDLGANEIGQHEYMRMPAGKVIEDTADWLTQAPTTWDKKLSPIVGATMKAIANDRGFGHAIEDPTGGTLKHVAEGIGFVIKSQIPFDNMQTIYDMTQGVGTPLDQHKTLGFITGLTTSQGSVSGPEGAVDYATANRVKAQKSYVMDEVKRDIKYGKDDDADALLESIGFTSAEINKIIRNQESPSGRESRQMIKDFNHHATDKERELKERLSNR